MKNRGSSGYDQCHRVVIVGGGFSAAAFAVQFVRNTRSRVDISIVEPRANLGCGLAYSATDSDHRLNAPASLHSLDPDHPEALRAWCVREGVFDRDPECFSGGGYAFLRRGDFGAFVTDQIAQAAADRRLGSSIHHVRDYAVSAEPIPAGFRIFTDSGQKLTADLLVVATGTPVPALRHPFRPEHAVHPRIVGNPLEPGCLDRIPPAARVLVVGSGLTALDVLSTLVRRGHQSEVLVISRRGLRPRAHPAEIVERREALTAPSALRFDVMAAVPAFIAGQPATARHWLRAVRAEISRQKLAGHGWHSTFDAVRNAAWKIWPRLPLDEQRRFLRRLGAYYDVHCFRTPPMNEQLVREAEQRGFLRFVAARIGRIETPRDSLKVKAELVEARTGSRVEMEFDFIVNCTGLEHAAATRANPFLRSLLEVGLLRPHGNGLGFDVGANCEAYDASGRPQPGLRVIGPPSAGASGDPLGAIFIAAQVHRILPDVMDKLEAPINAFEATQREPRTNRRSKTEDGRDLSQGR